MQRVGIHFLPTIPRNPNVPVSFYLGRKGLLVCLFKCLRSILCASRTGNSCNSCQPGTNVIIIFTRLIPAYKSTFGKMFGECMIEKVFDALVVILGLRKKLLFRSNRCPSLVDVILCSICSNLGSVEIFEMGGFWTGFILFQSRLAWLRIILNETN
jgi:hypothetical protein